MSPLRPFPEARSVPGRSMPSHSSPSSTFLRAPGGGLQRRKTRELVSQFEALSQPGTPTPAQGTPTPRRRADMRTPSKRLPQLPLTPESPGGRTPAARRRAFIDKASPLRQSVRHFLATLNKRENAMLCDGEDGTGTPMHALLGPSGPKDPAPAAKTEPVAVIPRTTPDTVRFTGPLMHLHPEGRTWSACTAKLRGQSILLTPDDASGTPPTTTIDLVRCSDVRSISHGEIDEHLRCALRTLDGGTETGERKVFELIFEGRPKERFAASSIKARAAWVSAIWDAILHSSSSSANATLLDSPSIGDSHESPPPLPEKDRLGARSAPATPRHRPASRTRSTSHARRPSLDAIARGPSVRAKAAQLGVPSTALATAVVNEHASDRPPTVRLVRAQTRRQSFWPEPSSIDRTRAASAAGRSEGTGSIQGMSSGGSSSEMDSIIDAYSGSDAHGLVAAGTSSAATSVSDLHAPAALYSGHSAGTGHGADDGCSASIAPLIDVLQVHALKHQSQTAALGTHIIGLREDMARLTAELDRVASHTDAPADAALLGAEAREVTAALAAEMRGLLEGLEGALRSTELRLAQGMRNREDAAQGALGARLDELLALQRAAQAATEADAPAAGPGADVLATELINVARNVGAMRKAAEAGFARVHEEADAAKVGATEDTKRLHAKVDTVLELLHSVPPPAPGGSRLFKPDTGEVANKLSEILTLLRDNEATKQAQMQQQAESGQYLGQLASWLDAYVRYSVTTHQTMAANIEHMTGCLATSTKNGKAIRTGGAIISEAADEAAKDLASRGLLINTSPSQASSAPPLASSLNGLISVIQTSLGSDAQARDALYQEMVCRLPDRQRHDQEQMMRTFAAELSAEIRGERIRFVDAMKEATSLNVHHHVEQFKVQLSREVQHMAQEVGRLQREKFALEQQISDLSGRHGMRPDQQLAIQPHYTGHQGMAERVANARPPNSF